MIKKYLQYINELNYSGPKLDSKPARDIIFTKKSFDQYNEWILIYRKKFKLIGKLIDQTSRDPFGGSKAEPLKDNGKWSKHIDAKNRLVYSINDNSIKVISCYGHYDDK